MTATELRRLAARLNLVGARCEMFERGERNAKQARLLRRVVSWLQQAEVELRTEASEAPLFEDKEGDYGA